MIINKYFMKKIIIFSGILFAGMFLMCSGDVFAASPGDVVITEFMANPTGSDTNKEWVEVRNTSGTSLSLEGWRVNDGSNHTISGSFVIPSNSIAVICRSSDTISNGGVDCDYVASITFTNTGDTIFLRDEGDTTIDSVTYTETDMLEGSSRYYDDGWQNEVVQKYNDTEYGTPGTAPGSVSDDKTGDISGEVELTLLNLEIVLDGTSVTVSFNINADSGILIDYGETEIYDSKNYSEVSAGDALVPITGLECSRTYHYRLIASSSGQIAESVDDSFIVTCGNIDIDSIVMTKTTAKASDNYSDGWQWIFDITLWDDTEDQLQMRFNEWDSSSGTIGSAGNMRFSVNGGATWIAVSADNSYSSLVDIVDIDSVVNGTQVQILVQMKVPIGTSVGDYSSQYGIRTE